jgi:hypothetical protein
VQKVITVLVWVYVDVIELHVFGIVAANLGRSFGCILRETVKWVIFMKQKTTKASFFK